MFRSYFPLSVPIFFGEPRQKRISTSIGARALVFIRIIFSYMFSFPSITFLIFHHPLAILKQSDLKKKTLRTLRKPFANFAVKLIYIDTNNVFNFSPSLSDLKKILRTLRNPFCELCGKTHFFYFKYS